MADPSARVTATFADEEGLEDIVEEPDEMVEKWAAEVEDAITALRRCEAGEGVPAVAASCLEGEVVVLETATGNVIHELDGHKGGTLCLGVGKDPTRLASGGEDGRIKVWDLNTGNLLSSTDCFQEGDRRKGSVEIIACCSSSDRFAAAYGKDVWIVSFAGDEPAMRLESLSTSVAALALSTAMTVHVATDGKLHLYEDMGKGKISYLEMDHVMNTLSVDPTGKWVVAGCLDKLVHVWNMESGESFQIKGISSKVKICAFDPPGEKMVCNSGPAALVWPVDGEGPAGRVPCYLHAHESSLEAASWGPGGTGLLATGGAEGLTIVWDAKESRATNMPNGTRGPDVLAVVGVAEHDDAVMVLEWVDSSSIVAGYESGAIVCWGM